MQSLKGETDSLYKTIAGFEENTREAAGRADQADCDIRDYGKKVQQLEIGFDETNDKLTKAADNVMKTIMANDGKCSMDHRGTQDTGGPQGDKAPSVASACSPPALSRSCRDSRRE